MSSRKPVRKSLRKHQVKDRRATADARGTWQLLRRLRALVNRPIALQRRDGHWRLVLVERRRAAPSDDAGTQRHLRAELRARLLAYAPEHAAQLMHQLVQVHDALARRGWAGVQALPLPVLGKALFQAELLAREEPGPALTLIADRLRALIEAAKAPPAAAETASARPADRPEAMIPLEVTEADLADLDERERSWFGSLPPPADSSDAKS